MFQGLWRMGPEEQPCLGSDCRASLAHCEGPVSISGTLTPEGPKQPPDH